MEEKQLLHIIGQAIYERSGENIVALDVREESCMTDYVIIAQGNVDRHVKAIVKEVENALTSHQIKPTFTDGYSEGEWVVLDYLDFMVHVLIPEQREKYQLEKLWPKAPVIDLRIDYDKTMKER